MCWLGLWFRGPFNVSLKNVPALQLRNRDRLSSHTDDPRHSWDVVAMGCHEWRHQRGCEYIGEAHRSF
jgi:hypothetical protein